MSRRNVQHILLRSGGRFIQGPPVALRKLETHQEPHERLVAARERAGFQTASEAARTFGWNENTYRSHENGERGLKNAVAIKYARAFRVPPEFIIVGSKETVDVALQSSVLINGPVLKHGDVLISDEKQVPSRSSEIAKLNLSLHSGMFALQVTQDIHELGLLENSLLILNGERSPPSSAKGKLALIRFEAHRHIIRYVSLDESGKQIDLRISLRDKILYVPYDYIHTVAAIIPAGEWQKVSQKEFAREGVTSDDE